MPDFDDKWWGDRRITDLSSKGEPNLLPTVPCWLLLEADVEAVRKAVADDNHPSSCPRWKDARAACRCPID